MSGPLGTELGKINKDYLLCPHRFYIAYSCFDLMETGLDFILIKLIIAWKRNRDKHIKKNDEKIDKQAS